MSESEWVCQKFYDDYLDGIFFRIPNRRGGNYPDPEADAKIRLFEECAKLHPRPPETKNNKRI